MGETMNNEEDYAFDVAGYLHLPGVLSRSEVGALNHALDEVGESEGMLGWAAPQRELFRDLLVHPRLVWYLNQLIGPGYRLDQVPRLLGSAEGEITGLLAGGDEPRNPSKAYFQQNGRRSSHGLKVIWVLQNVAPGDGGLVVVQASHKSTVETPHELLTGVDDMGLVQQPALQAGDLSSCGRIHPSGVRPWTGAAKRLLTYWYAGRAMIKSNGPGPGVETDGLPEWAATASPAQKAVLYRPGSQGSSPPTAVNTDGQDTWVEEIGTIIHPSIYIRDPDSKIDEKEFYFWDLNGYVVVRGVMDEDWLARANEAVDKFQDRIQVGSELSGGSKSQAGTGRPLLSGLVDLPDPYNEPFRRMIAHPAIVHRLNWMGASDYRTGGHVILCRRGDFGPLAA